MRAPISARMLSGEVSCPEKSGSSACSASSCSTANGLPPAKSAIRARASSDSSSPPGSCAISAEQSTVESGSSASVIAFGRSAHQSGRVSTSSGRARQSSRIGAPCDHSGDVLDEVEERRLGPVDVVQDDHERPLARPGARTRAGRPGRSPRSSPTSRRESAERVGERGERHAFAVRAAGAVENRRLGSRPQLEREPRLADSGLAQNGQEDAATFIRGARERVLDLRELGSAADERRVAAVARPRPLRARARRA